MSLRLKIVGLLGGAVFCLLVYRIGVWAWKPSTLDGEIPRRLLADNTVLEFVNNQLTYSDGDHKSWEVHAQQIIADKAPGGSMSSLRAATFSGIEAGKVFSPEKVSPVASFSARHGSFELQSVSDVAAEIKDQYTIQWQLKLSDTVDLRSANGDEIKTDSLAILSLIGRHDGKKSMKIFWEKGGVFQSGTLRIRVNKADYDPDQGSLASSGGVFASTPKLNAQSQRAYWFAKTKELHFPDKVNGSIDGMPFDAESVIYNPGTGITKGRRATLKLAL